MGCNGGDMYTAFAYAHSNCIMSLDSYPYTALDGSCAVDESKCVMKVDEW